MNSSVDEIDPDQDPFLLYLQKIKLYSEVESNCYVVFIPYFNPEDHVIKFDRAFAENHIFKPSAIIPQQFVSIHKSRRTIEVNDDETSIKTISGYIENNIYIDILNKEKVYNADLKPFFMYLLDGPLPFTKKIVTIRKSSVRTSISTNSSVIYQRLTFSDHTLYFSGWKENEKALSLVSKATDDFNNEALIISLENVHQKLMNICQDFKRNIFHDNKELRKRCQNDVYEMERFTLSAECFVTGWTHDKVFDTVGHHYDIRDKELAKKIADLNQQGLLLSTLELNHSLNGLSEDDIILSIVKFSSFGGPNSAHENLLCLKDVIETLNKNVKEFSKDTVLATDDLLMLIFYVIVIARKARLVTALEYSRLLCPSNSNSEFNYYLTTFFAAVDAILNWKNHDTDDLRVNEEALDKTNKSTSSRSFSTNAVENDSIESQQLEFKRALSSPRHSPRHSPKNSLARNAIILDQSFKLDIGNLKR